MSGKAGGLLCGQRVVRAAICVEENGLVSRHAGVRVRSEVPGSGGTHIGWLLGGCLIVAASE